jgi:hypothetical protein
LILAGCTEEPGVNPTPAPKYGSISKSQAINLLDSPTLRSVLFIL